MEPVYDSRVAGQSWDRATDESQGGNIVRVRKQTSIARPVARAEGLLVESVGEESVIYDLDTKEAHCLKPLASAVFMYADGSRTISEIAELAAYRLETPVTEADVADAVVQLETCSLLDSGPLAVRDGLSRREAMSKFAKIGVAATATPLIASVIAPAAAVAGSKIPTGECCGHLPDTCTGGNPKCESGHCCQNLSGPGKECNACKCVGAKNDCSLNQCGNPPGSCPNITISGISTKACGTTSSGRCCYPDSAGTCCTVVLNTSGVDVSCGPVA
jgi:hypothetical protein